jgi:hypothetical protein
MFYHDLRDECRVGELLGVAEDFGPSGNRSLQEAVNAELAYLRPLGANENLAFASSKLGALEAILIIIQSGDAGLPVYQAVANTRTPFSGPAGKINRLRAMRSLGLLEEKSGAKKSQVCLVPSEKLMRDLYPVIAARRYGGVQECPPHTPPANGCLLAASSSGDLTADALSLAHL